ncbi:MAG TPA: hypothetical protein VN903_30950, partial [Polyangia bacterium]|nr:hypothetical protein [Polyangia bacterium]
YGVDSGTPSVKATPGKRIAGLNDVAGNVNTTTRFDMGNNGDNVRSATTLDGAGVWIGGAGSGTLGGVWSNTTGAATGELHTALTPDNVRCLAIFGGQLYGSAGSGTFTNVFAIGAGTPTATGQTAMSLPGMPTSTANPYGFAMFDLSDPVGVDTMYVADDRTIANGGGIQKWTYDVTMSKWVLAATFSASGITTGFRGVAGYASAGTVTLMASTAETALNHLVVFVDTGSGAPTATTITAAASGMIYRGVAVSPHF